MKRRRKTRRQKVPEVYGIVRCILKGRRMTTRELHKVKPIKDSITEK